MVKYFQRKIFKYISINKSARLMKLSIQEFKELAILHNVKPVTGKTKHRIDHTGKIFYNISDIRRLYDTKTHETIIERRNIERKRVEHTLFKRTEKLDHLEDSVHFYNEILKSRFPSFKDAVFGLNESLNVISVLFAVYSDIYRKIQQNEFRFFEIGKIKDNVSDPENPSKIKKPSQLFEIDDIGHIKTIDQSELLSKITPTKLYQRDLTNHRVLNDDILEAYGVNINIANQKCEPVLSSDRNLLFHSNIDLTSFHSENRQDMSTKSSIFKVFLEILRPNLIKVSLIKKIDPDITQDEKIITRLDKYQSCICKNIIIDLDETERVLNSYKIFITNHRLIKSSFISETGINYLSIFNGIEVLFTSHHQLEKRFSAFSVDHENLMDLHSMSLHHIQSVLQKLNSIQIEPVSSNCIFHKKKFYLQIQPFHDFSWFIEYLGGYITEKVEDCNIAISETCPSQVLDNIKYLVPQFIFDSFNNNKELDTFDYVVGKTPPEHTCPFENTPTVDIDPSILSILSKTKKEKLEKYLKTNQ